MSVILPLLNQLHPINTLTLLHLPCLFDSLDFLLNITLFDIDISLDFDLMIMNVSLSALNKTTHLSPDPFSPLLFSDHSYFQRESIVPLLFILLFSQLHFILTFTAHYLFHLLIRTRGRLD